MKLSSKDKIPQGRGSLPRVVYTGRLRTKGVHCTFFNTLGARDFSSAVSGFSQAEGRRRVSVQPMKLLVTSEKKSVVPRVLFLGFTYMYIKW